MLKRKEGNIKATQDSSEGGRGLAKADKATRQRVARAGGEASSGKFKTGDKRTKDAAKKGGESSH